MPAVPILQVLYRRKDDILFGWKALKRTEAKAYNVYASLLSAGPYSLIKSNIPNEIDKSVYRGKVVCVVKDTEVPIAENEHVAQPQGGIVYGVNFYFKLTFIDPTNVESNIALSDPILVRPINVEPFYENENEAQNEHLFGWVEERHRWEKLTLSTDGKLPVDATVNIGQITLGNVKVAARPDGTTLEYILVDNNREVIARLDPNSISRVSDYEETNAVAQNIETTILTYTNAQPFFIEKVVCSGSGDAVFKFKINSTANETLRNSWNNRNVTFDFSTISRAIAGGATITITAKHNEKQNLNFEASLLGFTFTI